MNRILIMQTAFAGDVVLLLPMIYTLRLNYPAARLEIVIRSGLADLLRPVAELDTIIEYDKRSLGETVRLLKRLRQQRYDIAFLPHRSLRTALLAALARIPRRIGFNRGGGRWLHTDRVMYRYGVHEIERNFDLLNAAGITRFTDDYRYRDTLRRAPGFSPARLNLTEPYVVISPGSQWETKRWPMERYRDLAERISARYDVTLVITGTKNESALGAAIAERITDSERVKNMCGATDLTALLAVIRGARLLIANDSAAIHLASALDVPSLCIMGPTVKNLGFYPIHPRSVVCESAVDCRPCSPHGPRRCPHNHFRCMKDITVDQVFAAFEKLYEGRGTSS